MDKVFASSFLRQFHDREKMKSWILLHSASLRAWVFFLFLVFLVFQFFSDGDFSFLLTLSSLIGMFTFFMIAMKIETTRSAKGVSLKMIECYVLLLFARLCSIIPFEGYLPYDKSGDWVYQVVESISVCLAGSIVYLCRVRYKNTYNTKNDSFYHWILVASAFILALILHPSLISFFPADVAWTFALYLEAVCVLPQLFMFQKEGKVEPFMSHFLAGQALSKVFSFVFWISSYSDICGENKLQYFVGIWVIVMQVIQLLVMADFIFQYIKCISQGVPVEHLLQDCV